MHNTPTLSHTHTHTQGDFIGRDTSTGRVLFTFTPRASYESVQGNGGGVTFKNGSFAPVVKKKHTLLEEC
jgi:hypothetical protein